MYLAWINSVQSFVYRYISDPKEYCNQAFSSAIENSCVDQDAHLPINPNSTISQFSSKLNKDLLSDYNDILDAQRRSRIIAKQAANQIKKFKKQKAKVTDSNLNNKKSKINRINENAQIIATLNFKLEIAKNESPRCFVAKDNECSKKESDFFKDEIAPLLERKAKHLALFPILNQKSATQFIDESVKRRLKRHNQKINDNHNCLQNEKLSNMIKQSYTSKCRSRKGLLLEKSNDYQFKFSNKEAKKYLKDSINSALKSTKELRTRHQSIVEKIDFKLYRKKKRQSPLRFRIKGMRDTIFHDRTLTTDYFATLTKQEIGNTKKGSNKYICNILKENDANNINATINSVALDAATLLIPLGSPFLVSKVLNSFSKARNITNLQSKVVLGSEFSAMSIDSANLSNEAKHCQKLNDQALLVKDMSSSLKKEYEKCKDTLDSLTMSYTMAMLGGTVFSISDIKKVLPTKIKSSKDSLPVTTKTVEKIDLDKNTVILTRGENERTATFGASEKALEVNRRTETPALRSTLRDRRWNGIERRNLDTDQRVFLNDLEKELSTKKAKHLAKYNKGNRLDLDSRDEIYLAGYIDLLEKELMKSGKTPKQIKKLIKKDISKIMKDCKKVTK